MKSGKWTTVSRLACLLLIVFMIPGTALSKGVAKKPEANKPFMIKVVDAETGRGIPLVRRRRTISFTIPTAPGWSRSMNRAS